MAKLTADCLRFAADLTLRNTDIDYGVACFLEDRVELIRKYRKLAAVANAMKDRAVSHKDKCDIVYRAAMELVGAIDDLEGYVDTFECANRCAANGNYYQALDDLAVLAGAAYGKA